MKKIHFNIRLTKSGVQAAVGITAGVVVLALLVFFALFKVNRVEVVGSTKYTDAEIRSYALTSPLTSNSLLAVMFKDHIEAENIPFVESFDLEQLDRHTMRIHVNEKKIVGYVVQGTDKLYFDKDGKVVEMDTMTEEELQEAEAQAEELQALKAQEEREEALKRAREAEEALTGEQTEPDEAQTEEEDTGEQIPKFEEAQTLKAEEAAAGNESATEFHAAVTDVPRVVGLDTGEVQLGKKIKVKDRGIFNTILGITRIVEKYRILPEVVTFDSNSRITLVYNDGRIHCQLGKDTLLEEKITRVAAILPKLENESGILHLEDYNTEITNIIFSRESLYALKKKIAEMEGIQVKEDPVVQPDVTADGEGITEPDATADGEGTTEPDATADGEGTTEPEETTNEGEVTQPDAVE